VAGDSRISSWRMTSAVQWEKDDERAPMHALPPFWDFRHGECSHRAGCQSGLGSFLGPRQAFPRPLRPLVARCPDASHISGPNPAHTARVSLGEVPHRP
jgi:hypothetical protein